jgi:hypothetical protein
VRLSKRQREQVVELLRCAADVRWGCRAVARQIGVPDAIVDLALRAHWATSDDRWSIGLRGPGVPPDAYRHELLETAARVEEGSWP